MKLNLWAKNVFNSMYEGILIIDKNGIVKYVNESYTRITGVPYNQIIEHHLKDVRPGARLCEVVETGKKSIDIRREENGVEYMVNMTPIFEDGVICGGVSITRHIDDVHKLAERLEKYVRKNQSLQRQIQSLQNARYTLNDIIAVDEASLKVKNLVSKIAARDVPVLITGESGTGKELYAQALHNASDRSGNPFIAVNCATLKGTLLESELFGYEGGSFTGAKKKGKIGLFEAANHGTIFLDEISEMSLETQAQFLRVLQEQTIRRIGGIKEVPVDVRVIAASNRNLEEMSNQGLFREDLYFRIAIFPIEIPALRLRKKDIIPLTQYFLAHHKDQFKRDIAITRETEEVLFAYDWPGNIRELRNTIEFSINMIDDEFIIDSTHLPKRITSKIDKTDMKNLIKPLSHSVKEFEKREIEKALEIFGFDVDGKRAAAEALHISLASLYNKLNGK